jgi:hypothetical protein
MTGFLSRGLGSAVTALLLPAAVMTAAASPEQAVAAPPAGPGTIVYLKGYDVYVALPDGSGERRLTTNGTAAEPWTSPSGSDTRTVAAARGAVVYHLDQWGTVLNSFDPPDLVDAVGQSIGGTVRKVAMSPDGALIAYTFQHYNCALNAPCRERYTTAISAAGRLTDPKVYGYSYDDHPNWVTNSRLVLNGIGYDAIRLFDPGQRNQYWFNDADSTRDFHHLVDPALSRDGRLFAAVRSYDDEPHIATYAVSGNALTGPAPTWPTPWPALTCVTDKLAGLASPTFAPDVSALAWEEPDGIWIKPAPLDCAVPQELAIPGARTPSWTAAALQTTRPEYPEDPEPAQPFKLREKPRIKAPKSVRPGHRLVAVSGTWRPAPTSVRYQWLRDGKALPRMTKARYRVKKSDRRHRLSVKVTVTRSGYKPTSVVTRAVRVRR